MYYEEFRCMFESDEERKAAHERWVSMHLAEIEAMGATDEELWIAQKFGGRSTRGKYWWPTAADFLTAARREKQKREKAYHVDFRGGLLLAGAPERLLRAAYDKPPIETEALKHAREWSESNRCDFLTLLGGVGIGKSLAALWAMIERSRAKSLVLGNGQAPSGYVASRFVDARRLDDYARRGDGAEKKLEELCKAPLVVIDDLGAEYLDKSGWLKGFIDYLINERYENCQKTIITGNLTTMTERYGERLVDRILGAGEVFELGGKSMRTAGVQQ